MRKRNPHKIKLATEEIKDRKARRTTLLVAALSLFGVLTTAVITNIDKWIKPSATPPHISSNVVGSPNNSASTVSLQSGTTQTNEDEILAANKTTSTSLETTPAGDQPTKIVKTTKTETIEDVSLENTSSLRTRPVPSVSSLDGIAPGNLDSRSGVFRRKTTTTTTTVITTFRVVGPTSTLAARSGYNEYKWMMSHPHEYEGNHWDLISAKMTFRGLIYHGFIDKDGILEFGEIRCLGRSETVRLTVKYYGPPRSIFRRRSKFWPEQIATADQTMSCKDSTSNRISLRRTINDAFVQRGRSPVGRSVRRLITYDVPDEILEYRTNIKKKADLLAKLSKSELPEYRKELNDIDKKIEDQNKDWHSYIDVWSLDEKLSAKGRLKIKEWLHHDSDPKNSIRFFKNSREYQRIKHPPYP
jgi:hypothetical protein